MCAGSIIVDGFMQGEWSVNAYRGQPESNSLPHSMAFWQLPPNAASTLALLQQNLSECITALVQAMIKGSRISRNGIRSDMDTNIHWISIACVKCCTRHQAFKSNAEKQILSGRIFKLTAGLMRHLHGNVHALDLDRDSVQTAKKTN